MSEKKEIQTVESEETKQYIGINEVESISEGTQKGYVDVLFKDETIHIFFQEIFDKLVTNEPIEDKDLNEKKKSVFFEYMDKTVQETELLLTKTPEEAKVVQHRIAGWLLTLLTGMDADGMLVSYLFQSWGVHVEAKMKEIMTPFRDTYGAILDQAMTEKFGYSTNQIPFNIIYNISKEYGSNMNKS